MGPDQTDGSLGAASQSKHTQTKGLINGEYRAEGVGELGKRRESSLHIGTKCAPKLELMKNFDAC